MKKIILSLLVVVTIQLNAQDVNKITIPSTPAFSILGYEPSSVMRPTSTKKLSSDILNSFDKNGKLQMNLGLEVAPYWLKSRKITRQTYLNPDVAQSFWQTLKISAATVKDTVTGNNNLGVGFRFVLFQGKVTDDFEKKEKELNLMETIATLIDGVGAAAKDPKLSTVISNIEDAMKNTQGVTKEHIIEFKKVAYERSKDYADNSAGVRGLCAEVASHFANKKGEQLAKDVIELNKKRTGLSLEIAGASKFITTSTKDPFNKFGLWLNLNNYTSVKDAFSFTGRWFYSNTDTTLSNLDAGLSYSREEDEFNISIEAMARWYSAKIPDINSMGMPIRRAESKFTYRLAAQAAYKINKDVSLNLSFGKNFEDLNIASSGFFSIFGLNYSLFNTNKNVEIENPKTVN
jgi:hypothetical protein